MNYNMDLIHIRTARLYRYKSICFEWHDYLGPTFCKIKKPWIIKNNQCRSNREYGLLGQFLRLTKEERGVFSINY